MTRSSKPSDKVDLSNLNSVSSNVVKIAQSFAFGRKGANQGGLPGLTIGFFQQSLDSWRAFVIFVQFILKTVAPHEASVSDSSRRTSRAK